MGDLSGSIAVEDSDTGQELRGGVRYRDNRFIAGLDHSLVYSDVSSQVVRSVSRANFRTGLAYADGSFALGPNVGDGGFAMVRRGAALREGRVLLNPTDDGAQAAADAFGPGVIGGLRGYSPGRIQTVVETDLPGFENAAAIFNLLPSARSGYVFTVGETAEITLVTRLTGADGSPLSLATGRIVSLDREGVEFVVFTNRDGRYVGENLGAGRWRIDMPQGSVTFTLTEDQVGIVRLPDLVFAAEPTP
jgi:outer membrane usher protein